MENIVFVNEQAIKLHTGAGQDTSIAATDVKYGTELNISKVEDGWGRTTYQNKECWIDMNVVGFYASEYWQVERCDGSTNGIKLRKSSTEDSEQLTTVPLCTKFQRMGEIYLWWQNRLDETPLCNTLRKQQRTQFYRG